jgi:hypothetical protein
MFGWVLAPIGKLAPDTALTVWGVLQVTLTALMVVPLSWLFLRGADRYWWRLGYFGLCLTSIPLFHNFKWGQVSVLLTVCVIMAAFFQRGRAASALAGFLVAFAAAIKFYPAVFLLIFLSRKQWLALASSVIMFVLLLALPMWPMGYDRFKSFSTAKLVTVIEKEVVEDPNSQYVVRVLAADFPSIFDTKNAIAVLKPAGRAVAVLNILLVFGTGLIRIPEESKRRLMACLLFLMLPFVLTTSWMHYLVYLPFCQICLPYEATRLVRDTRWLKVTVWVLAGVSAILSSIPMARRQADWIAYVTPGFGFYANLAALLAAYIVFTGFMTSPPVSTTSDQPRFP